MAGRGFRSPVTRCWILKTNDGMCPVTASRSPGPNSCIRFIPASLPTVEPKSPIGAELERNQYGREALCAATEVNTLTR